MVQHRTEKYSKPGHTEAFSYCACHICSRPSKVGKRELSDRVQVPSEQEEMLANGPSAQSLMNRVRLKKETFFLVFNLTALEER